MLKSYLARLLALFALASGGPAWATSVLPAQLDEIVDKAAVAFEGRCVDNRSELDPVTGLVVTYTTFEVVDRLKGGVGSTHIIKQVGGSLPDGSFHYKVDSVPTFTVGEEYVLFLAGVSSKGFSSPIALAQGRFGIRMGASGREVGNGRDFRQLTARIPQAQVPARALVRLQSEGQVPRLNLEDFKQIVRARVGGRQ